MGTWREGDHGGTRKGNHGGTRAVWCGFDGDMGTFTFGVVVPCGPGETTLFPRDASPHHTTLTVMGIVMREERFTTHPGSW